MRLSRSSSNYVLGGVCGGIGRYFDIDAVFIRMAFCLCCILGLGSPILVYVLMWILMPSN